MKKELLFWMGLNGGLCLGFLAAWNFEKDQEIHLKNAVTLYNSLQCNFKRLESSLKFVKTYQKEMDFLAEKGWFMPHNRLIGGEIIEKLCSSLNQFHYTFEPETIKNMEEKYTFKVTKIVVDVSAFLESDMYACVDSFLERFPGILVSRAFTFSRGEEVNEETLFSLKKKERLNFFVGTFIFEWVSMDKKPHEN